MKTVIAVLMTLGLLAGTPSFAQERAALSEPALRAAVDRHVRSMARTTGPAEWRAFIQTPSSRVQDEQKPARRHRSVGRVILGAAVGGVGGFFGGGFLGAAIEGNRCNCDDPGLVGFLIGAPTGAAVGGILGGKFLF